LRGAKTVGCNQLTALYAKHWWSAKITPGVQEQHEQLAKADN
jgi:hypothetical protein